MTKKLILLMVITLTVLAYRHGSEKPQLYVCLAVMLGGYALVRNERW